MAETGKKAEVSRWRQKADSSEWLKKHLEADPHLPTALGEQGASHWRTGQAY
ncbi:hypothetical protein USDA257_c38620 [Sinorhizobium fredii USDA 257]|uniref:Uncharacterized protein n=1 Tax=Sinorhizobium fredii (strain USDA 257) TaxID=1185652 RepID=I3X951_SINF2|nr:hypothetical protein USDA257_c38620 [Sinorhizobium fredii USDA 257]